MPSATAARKRNAIMLLYLILREASALSVLLQWAIPEPPIEERTTGMVLTLFYAKLNADEVSPEANVSTMCKKLLPIFFLLFAILPSLAYDFNYTYKGQTITYTIIDKEAKTCTTKPGYWHYVYYGYRGNEVSDDLILPEHPMDGNEEYTLVSISAGAFCDCEDLMSIEIPNSVISIGDGAFSGCTGLSSICIPDNVTTIGKCAFMECSGLSSITLGKSISIIGEYAFSDCDQLSSISVPKSVTNIGENAFSYCYNLHRTEYESLESLCCIEFSNVESNPSYYSHNIFIDGSAIKDIVIPDNVSAISDYAFTNCNSLRTIIIGSGVKSIGGAAFYGCGNINSITCKSLEAPLITTPFGDVGELYLDNDQTSISIPVKALPSYLSHGWSRQIITFIDSDTNVSTYTEKGIQYIYSLDLNEAIVSGVAQEFNSNSINIPKNIVIDEKEYNITAIGDEAFNGCSSIIQITIPNSVLSIGQGAFKNCTRLNIVYLGNSVCYIGHYAFQSCRQLKSLNLPSSIISIGRGAFEDCNSLSSISFPKSMDTIGEYAFSNCYSLTTVEFESIESLCNIKYDGTSSPFETAYNLYIDGTKINDIVIPNNVTDICEFAFYGAENIRSITIPNSVTNIGRYAFSRCTNLKSIQLPHSLKCIEDGLFMGCESLGSIALPESILTIGDGAFWGCENLISIALPESILAIGNMAFLGCEGLTTIALPESILTIGDEAFGGCEGLTTIALPESILTIGDEVFEDCNRLQSIYLANSISAIGRNAFYGCYKLKSITLPKSLSYIGEYAFGECNLSSIYCFALEPPSLFDNESFSDYNAMVYVPQSSLESYKSAKYWRDFKGFKAIEIPVEYITIECESKVLKEKQQTRLTANISPSNATNKSIIWSSSDENIAIIDNVGMVTAISAGKVEFTATACDNSSIEAKFEMIILQLLKGDSNDNGEVTITDAVNTANYAVGNEVENFCFEAADVNDDNRITLADASGTIVEILKQPVPAPALVARRISDASQISDFDCLAVDAYNTEEADLTEFDVKLDNTFDYVALQADILLPDGMTLQSVELGPRAEAYHTLMQRVISDNVVRVALFNLDNEPFADNDEAILKVVVKSNGSVIGDLALCNILASDSEANEYVLASRIVSNNGTSGINAVYGDGTISVVATEYGLTIFNAEGQHVDIYTVDGAKIAGFKAESNAETRNVGKGVYVVTAGEIVVKVIVK